MLRRKTVCAALVLAFAAAPAMAQSPINTLEWRGLNPQPEPPSMAGAAANIARQGVNPQPGPASPASNPLFMLGLNPQPEPPSANAAPRQLWIPPRP
jgi:hypothetical protein